MKIKIKKSMVSLYIILSFISIILFTILISDYWVEKSSKNFIYDDLKNIPYNKVGLVLGTIKELENGNINLYFKYRIDAAESLYKANKVKYLIVSGDNSRDGYNEPEDMKESLIKRGIPKDKIFSDFAGLRTLDSIVRANEIFEQTSFTVISQKFHNERAIFIAQRKDLKVIGFNAKDVNTFKSLKVKIREYLARVKVVLDIYILRTQPKFLGEKVKIE